MMMIVRVITTPCWRDSDPFCHVQDEDETSFAQEMTSGAIAHRSYSDGNLVRYLACDRSGVEDLEVRYLVRCLV